MVASAEGKETYPFSLLESSSAQHRAGTSLFLPPVRHGPKQRQPYSIGSSLDDDEKYLAIYGPLVKTIECFSRSALCLCLHLFLTVCVCVCVVRAGGERLASLPDALLFSIIPHLTTCTADTQGGEEPGTDAS